jgi:hypothetical protein
LLLVLILIAVAVILGISYLSVAALHANMGDNFGSMARARYLAESGVQHGLYILRYTPEQLTGRLGPYYVDSATEPYYIEGQSTGLNQYTLNSTAHVGNAKRTSSVTVSRDLSPRVMLTDGLMISSGSPFQPWGVTINGDVYVDGYLKNWAGINGNVSATGGIEDPYNRITGEKDGAADPVTIPNITIDQYITYTLNGVTYHAVEYTDANMMANDPLANGGSITADNIGGVIYCKPKSGTSIKLHTNLKIHGTLIIDGSVDLNGTACPGPSGIEITPVDGFPAIVCTGSVKLNSAAKGVVFNGLIVANQGIVPDGGTASASTTINGALITAINGYASGLSGAHVLNYDADKARIYNMSLPVEQKVPTVKVVNWND